MSKMSKEINTPFGTGVEETGISIMDKSDIATVDMMEQLMSGEIKFFSSIVDDGSRESKIDIYNAISREDKKIGECINEVIEVVDVVAHPITLPDEETGEIINTVRTILVDKNGNNYVGVSNGINSALTRIFAIIGRPDNGAWHEKPVKMKIKQIQTRTGNNKVNTIELVK